MFDFLTIYWSWLMSFDSILLTMFMLFVSAIGVIIALGMIVTLIVVPIFLILKFLLLTPLGWIFLAFMVWMFMFENKERADYGVDQSFVRMCSRTPGCAPLLHARDNLTVNQMDVVQPSNRLTPVQE